MGVCGGVNSCYNEGRKEKEGQISWHCEADLDDSVKFGLMRITCEGYSGANDTFILKGSCGLEYELDYIDPDRDASSDSSDLPPPRYNRRQPNRRPFIFDYVILPLLIALSIGALFNLKRILDDRNRSNNSTTSDDTGYVTIHAGTSTTDS